MTNSIDKHAVIYCRVSDVKQKIEGHGLESQEIRCVEYAQRAGYTIVHVFKDDASGGILDRPINRISRSLDVHLKFRERLSAMGASFETPTQKFGESADDRMVENMLVNMAEYQRRKNAEQTKNRMWGRLKNGYWVFQAPMGYKYEKVGAHGKLLVRDEPIASIIQETLEGYASGRFGSLTEMKRFLDSQNTYPKQKGTGKVAIQRMSDLIAQPLYAGYIEHKGWNIERLKGHHEPIISLETWQQCQDRYSGTLKSVATKTNVSALMPLRGFVKCGCCNSNLTGGRSKGRSKYYVYYECRNKSCELFRKAIPKAKIEGAFEGLLTAMKPSEALFKLLYAMLKDLWEEQANNGAELVRRAKRELASIESDIERLVDRTLDTSNATLAKRYEQRLNELETKKMVIAEKQGKIGTPRQSFEETFRTAMAYLSNPLNLWRSERLEDKRAVLKLTFSDQLSYHRDEGFRTANLSLPFKLLGGVLGGKNEMVPPHGLEPRTP